MELQTEYLQLQTSGAGDLNDITGELHDILAASGLQEGAMTVFTIGSTGAIITFEYEPGMVRDIRELFEQLAPQGRHYHHDDTWGDANGFSHLRAALQGPSLTVPFAGGKLLLGTWQQVVHAEFDHKPRNRKIVVQLMGE